jgi:hypothetical protein
MRRDGFFSEIAGASQGAASVIEAVGVIEADRALVAHYLADGYPVLHVPDAVVDPLLPDRVAGSSTVLTDGVWVWPHALAYFVRAHGVEVAPDLVSRAREHGWSVPELSPTEIAAVESELLADEWVETEFPEDPFAPLEEEDE